MGKDCELFGLGQVNFQGIKRAVRLDVSGFSRLFRGSY
jgi:hypothetical protein